MSSFSPIIHHATSILCSNKGSMELSQLHRAVFRSFADITEDTFWFIIEGCARFTVVASRPRAEDAQSERIVVAKTSLRLCKKYSQNECYQCQDLHLCKYFVYGNCRYGKGRKACKFSHNIQSKHNYPLLRECTLHELNEDDLFLLLLQNDPTLLPEVPRLPYETSFSVSLCPHLPDVFRVDCVNTKLNVICLSLSQRLVTPKYRMS